MNFKNDSNIQINHKTDLMQFVFPILITAEKKHFPKIVIISVFIII